MDSKLNEGERPSQSARSKDPIAKAADSKEKAAEATPGTSRYQDPPMEAESSDERDSTCGHSDLASQKSGATEIGRDMRSISINDKGYAVFKNAAQKKAFRRAIAAGKSREEALDAASKAISGPAIMPKTSKSGLESKETRGSFKEVVNSRKIGIKHEGDEPLTTEQMKLLEKTVLAAIRKMDNQEWKPGFAGTEKRSGWMLIRCTNPETAAWLKASSKELAEAAAIPITVMEEEEFPKPQMVRAFLPDSKDDPIEEIKDYLRVQGHFTTGTWSVVHRSTVGKLEEIVFAVDDASAEQIGSSGTTFSYKLTRAKIIRIAGKRKASDQEGEQAKRPKETKGTSVETEPKATSQKPETQPEKEETGQTKTADGKASTGQAKPKATSKTPSPNVVQLRERLGLGKKMAAGEQKVQQGAPKPKSTPKPGGSRPGKGPKSNMRQSLITKSLKKHD